MSLVLVLMESFNNGKRYKIQVSHLKHCLYLEIVDCFEEQYGLLLQIMNHPSQDVDDLVATKFVPISCIYTIYTGAQP